MPQKKIDERIRTLINNAIKLNNRAFFIIIGDRGKEQVNIYNIRLLICIIY